MVNKIKNSVKTATGSTVRFTVASNDVIYILHNDSVQINQLTITVLSNLPTDTWVRFS